MNQLQLAVLLSVVIIAAIAFVAWVRMMLNSQPSSGWPDGRAPQYPPHIAGRETYDDAFWRNLNQ